MVGAESIGGVFYFTNAFDTRTQGVDLVASYPLTWANDSATNITASMNYNKSEFASDPSAYLNDEDMYDFENFDPTLRGAVTATHDFGALSLMARANWYGSYKNSQDTDDGLIYQAYEPVVQVDLEGKYHITDNTNVSVGGRNIFDEYPEMDELGDYCCGALYASDTVVDWQGSFYYMSLSHNF